MIVDRLPPCCPRCSAPLSLDRAEMSALARENAGMDQQLPYVVYLCAGGHTVQVGAPVLLRERIITPEQPRKEVAHVCPPPCGKRFLGRLRAVYCCVRCASTAAHRKREATRPEPKGRGGRPAYVEPARIRIQTQGPYASRVGRR